MRRRKRCPYCRFLFWPDTRTAWHQRACSKPGCQAARRRDTQRRYREKNAGDQQARRYRAAIARLKDEPPQELEVPRRGIFRSLLWEEAKDEIEPQVFVFLVFFAQLLVGITRDEKRVQVPVIQGEIGELVQVHGKDEMEPAALPG